MAQAATAIDAKPGFVAEALPVDLDKNPDSYLGEGLYSRRLTDKILSAFNQAYATGDFEVADMLRVALDRAADNAASVGGERKIHAAITQADLWVRYVDARNAFKSVNDPLSGAEESIVDKALVRMKDAYRRWSAG